MSKDNVTPVIQCAKCLAKASLLNVPKITKISVKDSD